MNKRRYIVTKPLDLKINGKSRHLSAGEDVWAYVPLLDPVKVLLEGRFDAEVPLNIFSASVRNVPAKGDLVGTNGRTGMFKVTAVDHNDCTVDLKLADGSGPLVKKVPWTTLISAPKNGGNGKSTPRFF